MNIGKTVFAQMMEFLPPYEFQKCVERYQGNYKIKSFSCWDQFLCMAFAQLTYRESLRDIQACLRGNQQQTLSHGLSRNRVSKHLGSRQPNPRLENLRRLRPNPHYPSPNPLRSRRFRHRAETNGLCLRCHHHRSLFIAFPVGPIPSAQRSDQTPHLDGFTGQHSHADLRNPWQGPRGQSPRRPPHRTRGHLHLRPRISGLCTSLQNSSGRSFFHHPGQKQFPLPAPLFPESRQKQRRSSRSDHRPPWLLCPQRLSRPAPPDPVLRCRKEKTPDFPNQPLYAAWLHDCGALSLPVEDRIIFQMDQAASPNQGILWNLGECRQRLKYGLRSPFMSWSPS